MPMQASRMPTIVITTPLIGFSPTSHVIEVIAMSSNTVISDGPKARPTRASAGPRIVRIRMPIVPPMKDAMFAVKSACPGRWRFVAIG